ncbi:phage tail protein [Haloarchaeobius amylolyticus]|uniref:Phage tail protein n=1 Tax=Haloarchaeobius amylolyticus TaxID=1198296 RepID=A0ABD6BJ98_9EURY
MDFSYATTRSTADWQAWTGRNVGVRDGGLELATTTAIERSPIEDDAVDVAIDSSGFLYTLRSSGSLSRHDPAADLTHRLWGRADAAVAAPRALCVEGDRIFVADGSDGSVTVVSTRLQRTIGTIETDATDPIRIAHAEGTLYLLDDGGQLRTVGQATGATGTCSMSLVEPVNLAVDTDGRGYVLDRTDGDPVIRSFSGADGHHDDRVSIPNDAFVAADGPFVPTALSLADGTLLVAGRLEDGSRALFERDPESGAFHERYRLECPCRTLVARSLDSDGRMAFYAGAGPNGHSRLLRERRRYARHPRRERSIGVAFHRYDAGTDGTEWHRLALDLSGSTASTQVQLRYVATDRPALCETAVDGLEAVPAVAADALCALQITSVWDLATSDVPRLASALSDYNRADVQAWQTAAIDTLAAHADGDWTTVDSVPPDDVLLRDAVGRYLYVALELDGSPQSSPRVDAVTAYCPRQSYLRYLPELYQEDDRSAAFLTRYLSVFESVFTDIEAEIDRISRYFDPDAVPSAALSWLEQWLALERDDEWPEDARRELLSRAPELYKRRGTKAGLRAMLELYLRYAASSSVDGSASSTVTADGGGTGNEMPASHRLFVLTTGDLDCLDREVRRQYPLPAGPRSFSVFCGPFETDDERAMVESIVASGMPAHVGADVVELDDGLRLAGDTFLGLNSRLTTREFSLGETTLGENTVLVDRSGPTYRPN